MRSAASSCAASQDSAGDLGSVLSMKGKTALALVLFSTGMVMPCAEQAFARGGGVPNLLNSPGYQRALEESRKRYRDAASQQQTPAKAATSRKTSKHRGHH